MSYLKKVELLYHYLKSNILQQYVLNIEDLNIELETIYN